jgi:hypothetical protein
MRSAKRFFRSSVHVPSPTSISPAASPAPKWWQRAHKTTPAALARNREGVAKFAKILV